MIVPQHSESPEIIEDLEIPVHQFLSNLETDLRFAHAPLKQQRFGTSDKLFSIAGWPEDDLHKLFKEMLPELSIPERFIFVKGLMRHAQK